MPQSRAKRVRPDNEDLKEHMECPVCMEIPREGPIFSCPNGHLVCQKCKVTTCPICRQAMGQHRSLLAVAVIEKIHHDCKHNGCDEVFKLDNLCDHEKVCKHRSVSCPFDSCDEKFALSKVLDHLKSSRTCSSMSENVRMIKEMTTHKSFTVNNIEKIKLPKINWRLLVCSYKGVDFALRVKKSGDFYNINIVMFESEVVCSKYNIEMEVYKSNSSPAYARHSIKFRGNPSSIDETKTDVENVGLLVHRKVMEKMVLEDETFDFTVSFSFF